MNHRLQLIAGRIDFYMSANTLQAFDAVAQNIPTLVVAAMFQKDPQVLLAHPDQGIEKFEDLKKLTLLISKEGVASYFQWMKHDFGFREQQVKPYTFNPQPFLADKRTAMQGYVTSEPYAIEKQGGFKPKIFLLADQGWGSYSTLIETRRDLVEKKPDLVQRFVDASAIGWTNYLYGDNAAANARIKRDNPEMTDARIAYSIAKMKEYGIVDSGDAIKGGIGAMTDARMKGFFDKMVASGVVKGGIDYKKAYSLQFVNKGVGVDLREIGSGRQSQRGIDARVSDFAVLRRALRPRLAADPIRRGRSGCSFRFRRPASPICPAGSSPRRCARSSSSR